MTLNIWNLDGPWPERRAEIVAWITRVEPDVVCLQEVVEDEHGRSQAEEIADSVGGPWHCAYGANRETEDGQIGNAVLSRSPVDVQHVVPLPTAGERSEGRVVLHARTGGADVFSTHLNWRYHHGFVREQQVVTLVDTVEALADPDAPLPPIVCGDLNAEPDATEIRFLTGHASIDGRSTYFQDAWRLEGGSSPGWTWDNRNPFAAHEFEPDRRLDYILVGWRRENGAGRVESARIVCDRPLTGTFASDHFGMVAEVATGPQGG